MKSFFNIRHSGFFSAAAFAVLMGAFVSCSNVAGENGDRGADGGKADVKTLKAVISGKEAGVTWAKELEGDRLFSEVYRDEKRVSTSVGLSPVVVSVTDFEGEVYPGIPGFGSLDTRSVPDDIKVFVSDFCNALNRNVYGEAGKFFDDDYYFNFVFFRNDFIEDWEKNFSLKFPQGKVGGVSIFSRWIFGQPVSSGDVFQLPVRFYCVSGGKDCGFVDFKLYIRLDNKKIYRISKGVYGK